MEWAKLKAGFDQWAPYIFYFFSFAILGWVAEVLVTLALSGGSWVNVGVLVGPYLPIYGFGAVIAVWVSRRVKSVPVLFAIALVASGVGEYLTSWVLEAAYHARWWDYSNLALNLNGRICLWVLVIFATVAAVGVKVLVPAADWLYRKLNGRALKIILVLLVVLFMVDVGYSLLQPNKTAGMPYDQARDAAGLE